jgi:hypothetical protein
MLMGLLVLHFSRSDKDPSRSEGEPRRRSCLRGRVGHNRVMSFWPVDNLTLFCCAASARMVVCGCCCCR